MPLQLAILGSGRGSNAKAILEAIQRGELDAHVVCLISNMADAPVLKIAADFGIPAIPVPHVGLTREAHEAKLLEALKPYKIDYLVLAGYMRLMTPKFLKAFENRVINIHPSLLPAFTGTHGYEDAYHYGVKVSGVTVHFVDEGLDTGPIIVQEAFPRMENDTLESFKARGLALEHALYPEALQLLAEDRLVLHIDPESGRTHVEIKHHAVC